MAMRTRLHRSSVRLPARAVAILLALFALLPSARLDLLAIALRDGCCCADKHEHDANCPCKVCTHKRHAGSSERVITTCAGVVDSALAVASFDPAFPVTTLETAVAVRSRAEVPIRQAPPGPANEVPTPPPLRRS
jgi:hypothetical protein